MKKYNIILLALLFFAFQMNAQKQSALAKVVQDKQLTGTTFQDFQLLEVDQNFKKQSDMEKIFRHTDIFQLNSLELEQINKKRPEAINLNFTTNKEQVSIQLVKTQVLTDDFALITSDGDLPIDYEPGVYYRGIVNGIPNSMAAISIFGDEMVGLFSTPGKGDYILGRILGKQGTHIGYYEEDLKVEADLVCDTPDPFYTQEEIDEIRELSNSSPSSLVSNCVDVYFELEYDLVQEKGGATGAANFMTGLYNVVATLYQNESITTQISEIFTWTSPDSYPTTSGTVAALNAFRTARPNYNGDLAHLVSRGAPSGGGVAWVDALCGNYGYAYSYIYSSYSNYPTYSWTINVIAHEMGHNLGSPHTHNCSWTGGAIDGCGPAAGYSEGCTGPLPAANEGTVMSYCHLVSSVGIGHAEGFGPQPGNLIRNRVANASCLSPCSTCPTTLNLSGTFSGTQDHEASSSITSTQTLTASADVDYKAGSTVVLNPGFTATTGSDFRAYIGNCNSNAGESGQEVSYADQDLPENTRQVAEVLEGTGIHCYPNPFNTKTTIEYRLEEDGPVRLSIHDMNGRIIQELISEGSTGLHQVSFDASDLAVGMYYARLQVADQLHTAKLLIIR